MKNFRKRFTKRRVGEDGKGRYFAQCPVCLKEFELMNRYTRRKYCSNECRRNSMVIKKELKQKLVQGAKEKEKIHICIQCRNKFSNLNFGDKICSKKCFGNYISCNENRIKSVAISKKKYFMSPEKIAEKKFIRDKNYLDYDVEIPDDSKYNFVDDWMEDYFEIGNW